MVLRLPSTKMKIIYQGLEENYNKDALVAQCQPNHCKQIIDNNLPSTKVTISIRSIIHTMRRIKKVQYLMLDT